MTRILSNFHLPKRLRTHQLKFPTRPGFWKVKFNFRLTFQVIHFTLAELATELELLRAGLYQAVDGYVKGNDVTQLASMLKLKAGRLGRIIPDKCLQYWGGMGFTNEVMISRMYR